MPKPLELEHLKIGDLPLPFLVPKGMGGVVGDSKEVSEDEIEQMLSHLRDARKSVLKAGRATSCGFCEQKLHTLEQDINKTLEVLNKTAMVYRELKQIKKNGGKIGDVSREVKNIIRQQG